MSTLLEMIGAKSLKSSLFSISRYPSHNFTHVYLFLFFFFFQAEDGIRDLTVTGVQTCALPIFILYTQMNNPIETVRFVDVAPDNSRQTAISTAVIKLANTIQATAIVAETKSDRKSVV